MNEIILLIKVEMVEFNEDPFILFYDDLHII